MKISSERSDLLVVGGGLAGICAAITASRQNHLVNLVEKGSFLGGRVGLHKQQSLDKSLLLSQVYQRDSGLLNELWYRLFRDNKEGTYIGITRVLRDWVEAEPKIKLFLNTEIEEVTHSKGHIQSVQGANALTSEKKSFIAEYFLDCTGLGRMAELSGAKGEKGVDLIELGGDGDKTYNLVKSSCLISIDRANFPCSFEKPEWVKLRWEENNISAKVGLMESLETSIIGQHLVQWCTDCKEGNIEAMEIALSAWDYLKNRSPFKDVFEDLQLTFIGDGTIAKPCFRAEGYHRISLDDFERIETLADSVCSVRYDLTEILSAVPGQTKSMPPPIPLEISLRSMLSCDFKNLLLVGSSACSSDLTSRSLATSTVAPQMGIAAAMTVSSSIEQKRLPRTICKEGYIDDLQRKLGRINQLYSRNQKEDLDNLSPISTISASSFITKPSDCLVDVEEVFTTSHCLFQFPVNSSFLEKLDLEIYIEDEQELVFKLLEGAGYHDSHPGYCVHNQEYKSDGSQTRVILELDVEIKKHGWYFLEVESANDFKVPLYKNGLLGYLLHQKEPSPPSVSTNSMSGFLPHISNSPCVSLSPKLEITPTPFVYEPSLLSNHEFRPNHLPQLWVSKPTNFKYPEFIEMEWREPVSISRIEISFDPSYEFIYPEQPQTFRDDNFHSLVKEYKIYTSMSAENAELIIHQKENNLPFVSHVFDPVEIKYLELEIISTHGLNRAQVFQVRTYA